MSQSQAQAPCGAADSAGTGASQHHQNETGSKEGLAGLRNVLRQSSAPDALCPYVENGIPIGSGVTEAACKTLVKQRLCCSGMRWTPEGAQIILSLRALALTETRWEQFWEKISKYGVPDIPHITEH